MPNLVRLSVILIILAIVRFQSAQVGGGGVPGQGGKDRVVVSS